MLEKSIELGINSLDVGNGIWLLNTTSSNNNTDIVGCAQIVMAITSIIMLWLVSRFNKKTLIQTQQQIEQQKKQWDKDFFLKYKQQKFLEFRTNFISIMAHVDMFHRIMGPGFIGIDMFNNDKRQFVYVPVVLQEYPTANMVALNALQDTQNFIKFMKNEDLFINDVMWLYNDILSFAESFANFLTVVVQKQIMEQAFHKVDSKLESESNVNMRILYLMNWPSIIRNNTRTSILGATLNKMLLRDLPGDNYKKFVEVANNNEDFYYYICVVRGWMNMWKSVIDGILLPNIDSIKLSKNCDFNREQSLSNVEEPVFIKVIPEN